MALAWIALLLTAASVSMAEPIRPLEALAPLRAHYASEPTWPPGYGWKPYQRLENDYRSRVFGTGEIPAGALWTAFSAAQRMPVSRLDEPWVCLGPLNEGGRATIVRFHPENPDIMFAGSASGGLFKSIDAGHSWYPATDDLPNLNINDLAFDPFDANTIYMTTGEGAYNQLYGLGMFKSTDGGNSWQPTGFSWPQSQWQCAQALSIDPRNSQTILVADYGMLYISHDGAETFTPVLAGDVKSIARDPFHAEVLLAAVGRPHGDLRNGIYRSTDGGETWVRQDQGMPFVNITGRMTLAWSASDSNVVYAGVSGTFGHNYTQMLGVYRSTDGGQTWYLTTEPDDNHYGGQGWFALALAVDPRNSSCAVSAGLTIFRTVSGIPRWEEMTFSSSRWHWPGPFVNPPESWVHADVHELVFHPSHANEIWAATDGGIFRSLDLGNSWQAMNNGFSTFQFYGISNSPTNPLLCYGGTQDNGTYRWHGETEWYKILDADGGQCRVDPQRDSTVYYEMQYGEQFRSDDRGLTRTRLDGPLGSRQWVTPIVLDPFDPNTIYSTTNRGDFEDPNARGARVWVSHDRGDSYYEPIPGPGKPARTTSWVILGDSMSGYLQSLEASPLVPGRLYAGSSGNVFRYDPVDSHWVDISNNLPRVWAGRVVADPHFPDRVYAVLVTFYVPHVWRSDDAGESWMDISGNLPDIPCQDIVVDPDDPNTLYLGTDIGMFMTVNGGEYWSRMGSGLPAVRCEDLDLQASSNILRVGTHGRGLWEIPLGPPEVRMLYPNGTEEMIVGGETMLRWYGADYGGSLRIALNRNYPEGEWEVLFASTPNDGSEPWMISGADAEHARFRITHQSLDQSDISNADSRIGSPRLNIVWPSGGETFPAGAQVWVRLATAFLPADLITLYSSQSCSYSEPQEWCAVASFWTNRDSLLWNVALPSAENVRLAVGLSRVRPGYTTLTDTLEAPVSVREPFLRVLYPMGGETLRVGDDVEVRWECEDAVMIHLVAIERPDAESDPFTGDRILKRIACQPDSQTQSMIWNVGGSLSQHARIFIEPCGDRDAYAMSGEFVIIEREVPDISAYVPLQFSVSAPYPNPFNPITNITLDLPENTFVSARVFNRLGQEVVELANKQFFAGWHTLAFDGSTFASGLYFIRIEAGVHRETFKAVLLK